MSDPISNILDPMLPDIQTLINIGIIGLILVGVLVIVLIMLNKWKRPIKYKATIFEKIGNSYRISSGLVFFKRTVDELGYYVEKRKIELDIKQGYLMKNGKTQFFLLKIEDRYIPIILGDEMEVQTVKGGKAEKLEINDFLAFSKLDEYEKGLTESIKHDARKYKWIDKLGPLLMIGLPIFALIIMFFIAAWVTRSNTEVVSGLQKLEATQITIANNWASIAKSFDIIATELGGPALAPPG